MIAKNVRQKLLNIQQSYDGHMDLMIQELDELERLAKIGRAVEQSTKTGTAWIYIESINKCTYPSSEEIQLLLEWAEMEE